MALSRSVGRAAEFDRWLAPFLSALSRSARRHRAPLYLKGLLLPGSRKSVEPIAARVAPGEVPQPHHFVAASPWATEPLEAELARTADRLVGGPGAVLVVDDTALVKQGSDSVGVQRQYCGERGKRANCQALVSLTLARGEVPVCVGLRLFLPETWAGDPGRRRRAGVPETVTGQPKWRIALDEVGRVLAAGTRFGCVLGDAEYGKAAEFRHGLTQRRLTWALGIGPTQKVFPGDVTLAPRPRRATGRPPRHPVPSALSVRRGREALRRHAAAGVPPPFLAARHQGAAEGALRRGPRAGGRRARGGARPAPAWRGGVARLRGARRGRAQVPPHQPPGRCAAPDPGRHDQGPLGARADAPADEERTRPRPLRGPRLARSAPPRPAVPDRLRLPAAPAARGERIVRRRNAGPPPTPSLPEVRRRLHAALLAHLRRCPSCGHRLPHHPLL